MIKSSLKIKHYKNTDIFYQGSYEKDFLDNYYDKLNIQNGFSIYYEFENTNKIYHPDFYLPDLNLIVEIKGSNWHAMLLEKNRAKQKKCIKNGYNFLFIIDKDYSEFKTFLGY